MPNGPDVTRNRTLVSGTIACPAFGAGRPRPCLRLIRASKGNPRVGHGQFSLVLRTRRRLTMIPTAVATAEAGNANVNPFHGQTSINRTGTAITRVQK